MRQTTLKDIFAGTADFDWCMIVGRELTKSYICGMKKHKSKIKKTPKKRFLRQSVCLCVSGGVVGLCQVWLLCGQIHWLKVGIAAKKLHLLTAVCRLLDTMQTLSTGLVANVLNL